MKRRFYKAVSMIMIAVMMAGQGTFVSLAEEETMPITEMMTEEAAETTTEVVTEETAETTAEVVTENIAELTTEAAAEDVTEKMTEADTEIVTERNTEAISENETNLMPEAVTEITTEETTEVITEEMTEVCEMLESETETVQELAAGEEHVHTDIDLNAECDEVSCKKALEAAVISGGTAIYCETISEAVTKAQEAGSCTLKLLKNIEVSNYVKIETGIISMDLNGKTLSVSDFAAVKVTGGTVTFLDSSLENTGKIRGKSEAVDINGGVVKFQSGSYEANTWVVKTNEGEPEIEINGGTFTGAIAVMHDDGKMVIDGGVFYGTVQASIVNNADATINNGTFYNSIQNFSNGTLTVTGGTIYIFQDAEWDKMGIENDGTLNLYGGTILEKADSASPCYGVKNESGARLNLYGDLSIDCGNSDFYLEQEMTIYQTLNRQYRIWHFDRPEGEVRFAKTGNTTELNPDWFKVDISGYRVRKTEDGALAYAKCRHEEVDEALICKGCGLEICAQIGDSYYAALTEAFAAVKEALAGDQKIVKLLADVSEDAAAEGGVFTIDLNGKTITGNLNIDSGEVKIQGNGGKVEEDRYSTLKIGADAVVELEDVIVKGKSAAIENSGTVSVKSGQILAEEYGIVNFGTLQILGGKIQGNLIGIVNFGSAGHSSITGGEIYSDGIAVCNYGSSMTIGADDGSEPILAGHTGIFNTKVSVEGISFEASLQVKGGTINAATDISNRTGNISMPLVGEEIPTEAGTVSLSGGTFTNGISAALDEGVDLNDLLADSCGYRNSSGQLLELAEGTIAVNETVSVGPKEDVQEPETETESEVQTEEESEREPDAGEKGETEEESGLETEGETEAETSSETETERQKETEEKDKAEIGAEKETERNGSSTSEEEVKNMAPDTGDLTKPEWYLLATMGSLWYLISRKKRKTA